MYFLHTCLARLCPLITFPEPKQSCGVSCNHDPAAMPLSSSSLTLAPQSEISIAAWAASHAYRRKADENGTSLDSAPIGQSATSSPRPDQADRLSIRALFSPRRGVFDAAVSSASPLPNKEVPHRVGLRMLRCVTRLRLLQLCQLILHDLGRQRDETVLHRRRRARRRRRRRRGRAGRGRRGRGGRRGGGGGE